MHVPPPGQREPGPWQGQVARGPGIDGSSQGSFQLPGQPCRRCIPSAQATSCRPDAEPGRYVSRGPGRWQREILASTGGVRTATVSGVVRTCVPEPDRNDFTAARRGAKGLAMAGKVMALYVYACQKCGHVQDHEPERCCGGRCAAPSP